MAPLVKLSCGRNRTRDAYHCPPMLIPVRTSTTVLFCVCTSHGYCLSTVVLNCGIAGSSAAEPTSVRFPQAHEHMITRTNQGTLMHAVRMLREHMRLGQVEFATLVGVSYPSIQRWERQHAPTEDERLAKFARLSRSVGRADLAEIFMQAIIEDIPDEVRDYILSKAHCGLPVAHETVPDKFTAEFQDLRHLARMSGHDDMASLAWRVIKAVLDHERSLRRQYPSIST